MQIRSMTFSKCEFADNYNRPMLRSMPPSWYVSSCAFTDHADSHLCVKGYSRMFVTAPQTCKNIPETNTLLRCDSERVLPQS